MSLSFRWIPAVFCLAACASSSPTPAASEADAADPGSAKPAETAAPSAEPAAPPAETPAADAAPADEPAPVYKGPTTGSCESGNASACVEKAEALEEKANASDKDIATARSLFEKACNANFGPACAELYERARRDSNADQAKLSSMLVVACATPHASSCASLADRYAEGKGIAKNHVKEVAARAVACEGYVYGQCTIIQGLAKKPEEKDAVRIMAAWKKACDGGDDKACSAIKQR
ncbi:MAG: hypothetical protein HOW73_25335 [Polyangiaceae bacterium]|nr:hypothetical protein [Polyangiaceae bacterium]